MGNNREYLYADRDISVREGEGAMEGGGGGEKVLPIERSPQARSSIHS